MCVNGNGNLLDTRKAIAGELETKKKEDQPILSIPIVTGTKSAAASSIKASGPKQTSCTFVSTHGEFTEQHWYNCYTCGLTWDKGCCSLCARVCHKGHDVGYSRKSSFFCDCGAEVRTTAGRISCKCLAPLLPALLSSVHGKEAKVTPDESGRWRNSSRRLLEG